MQQTVSREGVLIIEVLRGREVERNIGHVRNLGTLKDRRETLGKLFSFSGLLIKIGDEKGRKRAGAMSSEGPQRNFG